MMEKDFWEIVRQHLKLSNISPSDAERLHGTPLEKKGGVPANRTVQLLVQSITRANYGLLSKVTIPLWYHLV